MAENIYHVYANDQNGVEKIVGSYKASSPNEAKQKASKAINKNIGGVIGFMDQGRVSLQISRVVKEKMQKVTK